MKRLPACALLLAVLGVCADAAEKPNVVVILADDLGYGDMHANNPQRGKILTPNMDRLASEGMRFTDGHSSSGVCSPSRYTLLTGRYHWRTRLQQGIVGLWGAPLIAADRLTVGKLAQQHDYHTACVGKWHLGSEWPINADQQQYFANFGPANAEQHQLVTDAHRAAWREVFSQHIAGGPNTRGFHEYFGTDVPNWPPFCFIENDRTSGIPSELLPAVKFAKNQASRQGPALPGWQLEPILPALGERAARYIKERAQSGQPFLLYMPLTAPHTPIAVNEPWRGKSGLNDYADFVMETDATIGRVLAALDENGVADITLVFFTSDNGCAPYAGVEELEVAGHFPSGPLRGYKTSVYEGGHRVPYVVRWPGHVAAGAVCHQLVHQADLIATLAEILGDELPVDAGEDSFSIMPLLRGGHEPVRETAVSCAAVGTPGLRRGDWKLVLAKDAQSGTDVEMYNLAEDLGETKNLAAEKPALVAELRALMEQLIVDGRSTPGPKQSNDVAVRRFPADTGERPQATEFDRPVERKPSARPRT